MLASVPCATDSAIGVMLPLPMASHNQKSHVASHFDCLDLRNAMVALITPLASCDASAGTSGVTQPKKGYVAPYFNCLDLRNAVVPLMMPLASHDAGIVPIVSHGQKSHAAPHFN